MNHYLFTRLSFSARRAVLLTGVFLALLLGLPACGGSPAASARPRSVTPAQAREMLKDPDAVLVDVRTPMEFQREHIPGARLLPHLEMDRIAENDWADKEIPLILYCRTGARSAYAARRLGAMGFRNVYDLGGINRWDGETVRGAP